METTTSSVVEEGAITTASNDSRQNSTTHSNNIGTTHSDYDHELIRQKVYDQDCAGYLATQGIQIKDGQRINTPYRAGSDSCAFSVNGCFFHDPAGGQGGNVWQLACLMNHGDKAKARKSLFDAAGVPMTTGHAKDFTALADAATLAVEALVKVRAAFPIVVGTTPAAVTDYLTRRGVLNPRALRCLSYVPQGQLSTVLNAEEMRVTGLEYRQGVLICWYLHNDRPVYYVTRAIDTKDFKKAPVRYLQHPIFNRDDLYAQANVIWAEGMLDCLSLMTMGYGVAGEITCNLISAHVEELTKALWWRAKHHPEWTFTICLDNDEEKNGRRAGNEAAEKMARLLWSRGLDIKWVKHIPTAEKVDINKLHAEGKESEVRDMLARARNLSDIFGTDLDTCYRSFQLCLNEGEYIGAHKFLKTIRELETGDVKMAEIYAKLLSAKPPWRDVYTGIKDIILDGGKVRVFYPDGYMREECIADSKCFSRQEVCDNLRELQKNPNIPIKWGDFAVPAKTCIWRVAKAQQPASAPTYNTFRPSPMLLQKPSPTATSLPYQWQKLFENLADAQCREWLLNHMATYVQTLEKPRTMPVLYSKEGTGKNTLMSLFGKGVGDYSCVGNTSVESGFNEYIRHAVLLFDEFSSDSGDVRKLRNKLKSFINDMQTLNVKYESEVMVKLNNYIAISSNPVPGSLPVIVDANDRRYVIITGGCNQDIGKEKWYKYDAILEQLPDFMLYLLSRPIDVEKANTAIVTDAKQMLCDAGESEVTATLRNWMEDHRATDKDSVSLTVICRRINDLGVFKYAMTPQKMRHSLSCIGYEPVQIHKQYAYMGFAAHDPSNNDPQPVLPIRKEELPPPQAIPTDRTRDTFAAIREFGKKHRIGVVK
jgi:hypothetical protein